jgi:serine/threonine-protein kinase
MPASNASSDDLIGVTIAGRYRIISQLGAGGMGTAYRAWDEQGGLPVVVKIPKRVFLEDPKFAERFQREIRLLQGLSHPQIVPIVDLGEHEGVPFVVMRFLPGGALSNRRLRDDNGMPRPNPPAMLHLWLPAVAEALDFVHSRGVVHRDVKPANIFFDAFWGAYLGDFGIAKVVEESDAFDKELTLTATHMGIGTQEYMAPEQFTPKAVVDGRADQ